MKVTYLHQYFNNPEMGGSTRSYEMARRLVTSGHEVNLITSWREQVKAKQGWEVSDEAGIIVHWIPVEYSNSMSFLGRLLSFVKFSWYASWKAAFINADIVFASSTPLTIILPGFFASKLQRAPLVFEVRDLWPDVPIAMGFLNNPLLRVGARLLEWCAYRFSHHIVALAPGMRDEIIAKGIAPSNVSVIPNGCDLDIFGAEEDGMQSSVRGSHGWLQMRKLILFSGTLGLANDVSFLVKLASAMKSLDPEVRFVVIGDGKQAKKVSDLAKSHGVLDNSFFMLPNMPKLQLAKWIACCDFTVGLFSGPKILWKDAVQNKFFDALAAGKPMVCNFSGYQSELAVREGVGLIVPPDDFNQSAREVLDKLYDIEWCDAAAKKAKLLARTEFSRDRLAMRLEKLMIRVVESGY